MENLASLSNQVNNIKTPQRRYGSNITLTESKNSLDFMTMLHQEVLSQNDVHGKSQFIESEQHIATKLNTVNENIKDQDLYIKEETKENSADTSINKNDLDKHLNTDTSHVVRFDYLKNKVGFKETGASLNYVAETNIKNSKHSKDKKSYDQLLVIENHSKNEQLKKLDTTHLLNTIKAKKINHNIGNEVNIENASTKKIDPNFLLDLTTQGKQILNKVFKNKTSFSSDIALKENVQLNNKDKESIKAGLKKNNLKSIPEGVYHINNNVSRETSNVLLNTGSFASNKTEQSLKFTELTDLKLSQSIKDKENSTNIPNFQTNFKEVKSAPLAFIQDMKLRSQLNEQLNEFISKARMSVKDLDNASMTANLYPKELGKISVNLTLIDGVLQGNFIVENEIVQKALSEKMDILLNNLKEDGYSISSFQVNVQSESASEFASKNTNANDFEKNRKNSNINFLDTALDPNQILNTNIGGIYA